MKFSTVALSLPLIAMVQAGISSPTYYKPEHTEEIGVETVDYEFALGVREKCDEDTIYLVYEVDDGQLERNDKKLIVTANQNQLLIQLHVQAKLIGMVVTTTTNVMKIVTMKTKRDTNNTNVVKLKKPVKLAIVTSVLLRNLSVKINLLYMKVF